MFLLAKLRAMGAEASLSEKGLVLRNMPTGSSLLDQVKERKAEIIDALRAEALGGPNYFNSVLYYRIDQMVRLLGFLEEKGILKPKCERLHSILWDVDRAAVDSLEGSLEVIKAHSVEALMLAREICDGLQPLEGTDLLQAVENAFPGSSQRVENLSAAMFTEASELDMGAFA